jgi:hypothetical protein
MTEGKRSMTIRLENQAATKGGASAQATARRNAVVGDMQRVLLRGASALALSVAVASALTVALPLATSPAHADDLVGYMGGVGGEDRKGNGDPSTNRTQVGGFGNGSGGLADSGFQPGVRPTPPVAIDGVGADGLGYLDKVTNLSVLGGAGGQVGGTSVGSSAVTIAGGAGGAGGGFAFSVPQTQKFMVGTGGGGGGAGLFLSGGASTLTSGSSITGGAGGQGANWTAADATAHPNTNPSGGGGGGGGGAGIILRGTTFSNDLGSSITGGDGGDGGDGVVVVVVLVMGS